MAEVKLENEIHGNHIGSIASAEEPRPQLAQRVWGPQKTNSYELARAVYLKHCKVFFFFYRNQLSLKAY